MGWEAAGAFVPPQSSCLCSGPIPERTTSLTPLSDQRQQRETISRQLAVGRVPREPTSPQDLGAGMRLLRGKVSLRALEAASGFSRSQLSAFENGHRLPQLTYADELDRLYGGTGWVALAVRSLNRGRWDPWKSDRAPSREHAFSWHASYEGMVWVKIKPTPEHVMLPHVLTSEWGWWHRVDKLPIPASGVVLMTGKATDHDGVSRTYNLTAEPPVFALAGFGDKLDGENVHDIRHGWRLVNPAPSAHCRHELRRT